MRARASAKRPAAPTVRRAASLGPAAAPTASGHSRISVAAVEAPRVPEKVGSFGERFLTTLRAFVPGIPTSITARTSGSTSVPPDPPAPARR